MKKIITVDGPAGSGKEKISRYIAKKYNLYFLARYLEIFSLPDPAGPSTVIIFFTRYYHLHN